MNLIKKISGTLHQLRYNNFIADKYYAKKRKELLHREFINSDSYDDLMTKYDQKGSNYLNDAEERNKNFVYRHMKFHKILGGWRWKGLWQKKLTLIPFIFNKNLKGIDFGGANGPISLNVIIVDFADKDSFNRAVKYKNLKEVDFEADFIFSSHTLEHIKELDSIFAQMKNVLKKGAPLFFLVPAYTCKRWNSGVHTNRKFNDHAWTFYLEKDIPEGDYQNLLAFDTAVAKHFKVENADYVGDNSIFLSARNHN